MDWVYIKGRNPSTGRHETLLQYTYDHYVEGIKTLIKKIGKRPDYICGVHRGGLVPAVHLSYKLQSPLISLDWKTPGYNEKISEILLNPKNNVIMVDEIIDSGESANKINKMFGREFKWAVLVMNTSQSYIKDSYYHMVIDRNKNNEYVIFHWDSD